MHLKDDLRGNSAIVAPIPSSNAGTATDGRPVRFLRLTEVRSRVPYSRATIYRLVAAGQFPRPYSLGARAVAWLESEIHDWIETRVAGQNGVMPSLPDTDRQSR